MTSPFQDALREELRTAAHRSLRRRRWRWVSAIVAALGAAAGSLVVFWPNPVVADVDVEIRDGWVYVESFEDLTDPEEVRRVLAEAGIDAEVQALPVGPSVVGKFTGFGFLGGEQDDIVADQVGAPVKGFRFREGYTGKLVIGVGVPAEPGQGYEYQSDALAPDEPFECRDIVGMTVADAATAGELTGATVRLVTEGFAKGPIQLDSPAAQPYLGWYITRALAGSPSDVDLWVRAEPVPDQPPPC